jgi:methionyl-tRNA formyltransferase
VRIAFLGTPEVAVPALEALVADPSIEVAVVLCNPDRPKGRSRTPVPPPVKVAAEAHEIPVWQPGRPREVLANLAALELDACAVVAYGALLPADVLAVPRLGFVNLHFSLLPRWRGAAPVQHALRAGDAVTGVTTFVLDEGMDTGPVLRTLEVPIESDEGAGELLARLADLGAPVLVESLHALAQGATPVPQSDDGATLAPKIRPGDVAIAFDRPAVELAHLIRSADPAPGAHARWAGQRCKVLRAHTEDVDVGADVVPGTVLAAGRDGILVATGAGALRLTQLQPAGKPRMDAAAFANGARLAPGDRFEDGDPGS